MTSRSLELIRRRAFREEIPSEAVFVDLEIPFHDVDMLKVAWHGHYLKYLEIGRTKLFRAHALDVPELIELNTAFYVIESELRHLGPLHLGNIARVSAWFLESYPRVSVGYEIRNMTLGIRAARGRTTMVAITPEGQMLLETPDAIRTRIDRGIS